MKTNNSLNSENSGRHFLHQRKAVIATAVTLKESRRAASHASHERDGRAAGRVEDHFRPLSSLALRGGAVGEAQGRIEGAHARLGPSPPVEAPGVAAGERFRDAPTVIKLFHEEKEMNRY